MMRGVVLGVGWSFGRDQRRGGEWFKLGGEEDWVNPGSSSHDRVDPMGDAVGSDVV